MGERLRNVNVCGLTRVLVPAYVAALVVASLTVSDRWGWVAFVATALAIVAIRRVRGVTATCGLPATRPDAAGQADRAEAVAGRPSR